MFRREISAQSGQIGLIVLLAMVVLATIGISVATRTSQEVRTSRQTQESAQTFEAAESALERILSQPSDEVFNFSGNTLNQEFTDLGEAATGRSIGALEDDIFSVFENVAD